MIHQRRFAGLDILGAMALCVPESGAAGAMCQRRGR